VNTVLSTPLMLLCLTSYSLGVRLFQVAGPEKQKPHLPTLVQVPGTM